MPESCLSLLAGPHQVYYFELLSGTSGPFVPLKAGGCCGLEGEAASTPPQGRSGCVSVRNGWCRMDSEVILSKRHIRFSFCVNCGQPKSTGSLRRKAVANSFSSCHSMAGTASSSALSKHVSRSTWGGMHGQPLLLLEAVGATHLRKICTQTCSLFLKHEDISFFPGTMFHVSVPAVV